MDETEAELEDRLSPPRAPLRVMQILIELALAREGLSLARLSEQLQLPKTSVFSLLRSLEAGGYVVSDNGHHRLGQEAFNLASTIYQHEGMTSRLRPTVRWLQHQCDETAMLAVPLADWSALVFADVIESASSLRFTARVGAQRPLYSTSVGLALLAHATPDQQRLYVESTELRRLTPTTIVSAAGLKKALQRIRKDGFVVNSGSVVDASAIAAPVFGARGAVVASIGIAGPTSRIEKDAAKLIKLTVTAAQRMSEALGTLLPRSGPL
jgi:DNA-binding IclR family transcriptional regulator